MAVHLTPAQARGALAAVGAVPLVMVTLDLAWLGVIGRPFYQAQLGPLMAQQPLLGPAAAFYFLYISAIIIQAVGPARSPADAAGRGAWLGLVAYGTYELTNWAVIQGWPALLVPVDLTWGVLLTAAAAWVGRLAWEWAERRAGAGS